MMKGLQQSPSKRKALLIPDFLYQGTSWWTRRRSASIPGSDMGARKGFFGSGSDGDTFPLPDRRSKPARVAGGRRPSLALRSRDGKRRTHDVTAPVDYDRECPAPSESSFSSRIEGDAMSLLTLIGT